MAPHIHASVALPGKASAPHEVPEQQQSPAPAGGTAIHCHGEELAAQRRCEHTRVQGAASRSSQRGGPEALRKVHRPIRGAQEQHCVPAAPVLAAPLATSALTLGWGSSPGPCHPVTAVQFAPPGSGPERLAVIRGVSQPIKILRPLSLLPVQINQ